MVDSLEPVSENISKRLPSACIMVSFVPVSSTEIEASSALGSTIASSAETVAGKTAHNINAAINVTNCFLILFPLPAYAFMQK